MQITQNTILITGGSAGIGLEIARTFCKDNRVIIVGRNEERLKKAAAQLDNNVITITGDISNEQDVERIVSRLKTEFPNLNMLINNAGSASAYRLSDVDNAYERATEEIQTNYLSPIRLIDKLLPTLRNQPESAIVNVSSIVAFVPGANIPTYSASKAALHAYTKVLRLSLADTTVKVFDLMPPLVNTEFSKEIGGANGIAPAVVAEELYKAIQNNTFEIHVGNTADMYKLFHASPDEALLRLNQNR